MNLRTRRQFFRISAAIAVSTRVWAAKRPTCGIGIGTYGLQSMPLSDALKLIAQTGYDAAEIAAFRGMTGEPAKLSPADRENLLKIAGHGRLRLTALMADLKPEADAAKHAETTEVLRQTIELARDLRVPRIQTILGGKDWEASKAMFRDRLADWMQICADRKVRLAIKPHRSHAMSTPGQAAWLLEQLGKSEWLSMVYDYSHYAFRGMTIAETVKTAAPWTGYVAVKDAVEKDGKVQFALAGEGGNWETAEIVGGLFQAGYRGDFCCEVSSQIWRKNPGYHPIAATERCYRNLAAAFDRAGVSRG